MVKGDRDQALAAKPGFRRLTTTNVAAPLGLWTPLTNQFDQFGVLDITNVFDRSEPQRFFLLRTS